MFETKYKYFNKKIKMFLLLFILMWSLMGQKHVYDGKSSMYDAGIVMVADAAAIDFDNVTDGIRKTIQENIAPIIRTNDAMKTSSKIIATTETTEKKVKGINVATATIYGHINEKDNNSNKLPQNVKKRDQQQPNMMYMNMKMPAPSQTTSSASSLLSRISAGITTTQTAGILQRTTESLLMPKDQLNKAGSHENVKSNKNIPEDSKKRKILKVKLNDKRAIETVKNSSNSNNIDNNILKNNINNENKTTDSNLYETSNSKKFIKVKDKIGKNIFGPAIKSYESIEHVHRQLISQFSLKVKKIPRVTYFTCKKSLKPNESFKNVEFVRHMFFTGASIDSSLMMRIVFINHLANKNQASVKNNEGYGAANGSASRKSFNHLNWFEHILRPETLRQIVVLNLSCGASSRRLLEMASNKDFFNSMYHWLLLEDYVLNRQTEIDDANNIESKMTGHNYTHSTDADKRFKKEIVNDSNVTNLQVRKLSTYPTDVVDTSTSDSGLQKQNNITPRTNLTATSYSVFTMLADNRQEQCLVDKKSSISVNASRAGITTDEDDIEIIEKFLEKLNININTELILAKRCMRTIMPSKISSTATTFNMKATPSPSPSSASSMKNSTSTDSNDYNTLQKMDYYLLYDVWNPGHQYGGKLNVSEVGHFTPSEGLKLRKWYRTTSTTKRRIDMQLARIRCLIVVTHKNRSDTLEEYLTSHYDTHLDSMNRFNYALLTYVKDIFNFSIILSKTSSWGYLKNGKFDGMIGALMRKQVDIGGSPIFLRIERAKVIDYTARTWVARPCFIFRHPSTTKMDRIVFLQPFSYKVWMFLFFSGCLTVVLLWLLTSLERKFSPYELSVKKVAKRSSPDCKCVFTKFQHNLKENIQPDLKTAGSNKRYTLWFQLLTIKKSRSCVGLFFDSFLFYIGSICQQGLTFSTGFFSGRCIVITSLLFSFAIYQFYSASIVGTLLMEKPKTIRTLRDLIHSSLEIGVEDIVYNRDYFLRTKDPDAQELYAKKVTSVPTTKGTSFIDTPADGFASPTKMTDLTNAQKAKAYRNILHSHKTGAHAKTNEASNWYEPDYGVAKVKKGGFAFHVDVATAYKIIADTFSEKKICELSEIQLFPPQKMVSIVQKGSPLRKALTYGLRRITEVGLTDYQRKVWHSPKPKCVKQLHTDDLRVDMPTFTSALLVLIFGYAVSLLILSLEIVHFKLWQRYAMSRA